MTHWNEGKNTTLAREEAQHWHSIVKQTRELQLGALELGQVWEEAWQGWAKAWSPRGPWRAPGPCHVVTAPHTENRGHQPHGAAPLSPSSCRWGISGQANRKHLLSDPPHPRTAHKILCRRNKGVWEWLHHLRASVTRAVTLPGKRTLSWKLSPAEAPLHSALSLASPLPTQLGFAWLSTNTAMLWSNSCCWGSSSSNSRGGVWGVEGGWQKHLRLPTCALSPLLEPSHQASPEISGTQTDSHLLQNPLMCFESCLQAHLVVSLSWRPQHAELLQNKTFFAFTYYLSLGCNFFAKSWALTKWVWRKLLAVCALCLILHILSKCSKYTLILSSSKVDHMAFVEIYLVQLSLRHIAKWIWPFSCTDLWEQRCWPSIWSKLLVSSSQP
jgi:hypothetical protein